MDQATFVDDAVTYDATLRNLELIGEAATHIPSAIRDEHPEVPWRAIIAARNRLAHSYLSVDDDIIWTMIQDAIPKLAAQRCETCWTQPGPDQRRADGKIKPRRSSYSRPSSRMLGTHSIFGRRECNLRLFSKLNPISMCWRLPRLESMSERPEKSLK